VGKVGFVGFVGFVGLHAENLGLQCVNVDAFTQGKWEHAPYNLISNAIVNGCVIYFVNVGVNDNA